MSKLDDKVTHLNRRIDSIDYRIRAIERGLFAQKLGVSPEEWLGCIENGRYMTIGGESPCCMNRDELIGILYLLDKRLREATEKPEKGDGE